MRILSYLEPVAGCDPSLAIRLIARWREAWTVAGFKPLCLTEGALMAIPESKSLLEAPSGLAGALERLWLTAEVLKDGEVGIICHYDCLPGEDPWGIPNDLPGLCLSYDRAFGIGFKEQWISYINRSPSDPFPYPLPLADIYRHLNTKELRATLFPQTVQWHADKVEPPAQPQFGRQFAPRNKR